MVKTDCHRWTNEQVQFLRDHSKGISRKELAELVNAEFGLSLPYKKVVAAMKNRGITNGLNAKFKKGNIPKNKGTKGMYPGSPETQFKKGHRPKNAVEVGTETFVSRLGYVKVKVAEPNKWVMKHHLIWEEAGREIPEGHCLMFIDGNRENVTLDNLVLISKRCLVIINNLGLYSNDPEKNLTAIQIAELMLRITERKKNLDDEKHVQTSETAQMDRLNCSK